MARCPRCHRRLVDESICAEHGWRAPRSAELSETPPVPLDGWQVIRPVARGGSSVVYELSRSGARAVAKVARWRDADLIVRFADEAHRLRLAGPELVPHLIEHRSVDGWPYLVLEHLGEASLAGRIEGHGDGVGLDEAIAIIAGLARTVDALHRRGLVHCDLKPENVFEVEGGVRLIDLGMARTPGAGLGDTSAGVGGTAHYQAPEQLAGQAVERAADVYAIGVIGFELLTGRPPFGGERPTIEYGHLVCRPPRVSSLRAVPREIDELIDACLSKDPQRRPTPSEIVTRARSDGALIETRRSSAGASPILVALSWFGNLGAVDVTRAIERTRGTILGRRGGGLLAAHISLDHEHPLGAAIEAAALVAPGGAQVIHVDRAVVRRGRNDKVSVYGDVVNEVERWLPDRPWTGLVLTDAAAREHEGPLEPFPESAGFHRLVDRDRTGTEATEPPLFGRSGLLADLTATATEAVRDGKTALITLLGESGMGRSRMLRELRGRLDGQGPVIAVAARRSFGGDRLAVDLAGALGGDAVAEALTAHLVHGLVVLVDDAQWADDATLDALEIACGRAGARLAVIVAATELLVRGRPAWGDRAAHHVLVRLPRLAAQDAERLVRHLIQPVRRIPQVLVARIIDQASGNPGLLVDLLTELKRRGVIRRHPASDEWYVAADELTDVPSKAGSRWLAAQRLASLPPGLRGLAEACAVAGPGADLAEIDVLASSHPSEGPAVDPAAGVEALARAGILRWSDGRIELASASLQDAVEGLIEPARRRALHAAAFRLWQDRIDGEPAARLRRLAHHGSCCGEARVAAAAWIALAQAARRRHAHVEAEQLLSAAVEAAGDEAPRLRATALAERGRARRMLTHYEAARADFGAARTLAERLDDRTLRVDLLVAEAAVCDFMENLTESATLVAAARALAGDDLPPASRARLLNWSGVVHARKERLEDATRELGEAIALADSLDDHETAIGSMLMLGGVLRRRARVADGLRVLDDVIARCERSRDDFHLTVGLFNRINTWRRLGEPRRAEEDCQRAIEVAERAGLGQLEVWGWHNLSELRWCTGDVTGALAAATQSRELGRRRFRERPPLVGSVQVAFLCAGTGDMALARAALDEVVDEDVRSNPSLSLLVDAVQASIEGAPPRIWGELLARASRTGAEEDALSVLWLRAAHEARTGHADEAAATAELGRDELTRRHLPVPGPFVILS
mgnify:CR=1 FL=1